METPIGVLRDPVFFQNVKQIKALNQTEAKRIDREAKQVEARSLVSGDVMTLPYDYLVLAMGSEPCIPPISGTDLEGVHTLQGVEDAEALKATMEGGACHHVVIIGGGLIAMKSAEAFVSRRCSLGLDCSVTVVEVLPQVLSFLDPEMALLVQRHLESKGVKVFTGEQVVRIEGENGRATRVVTSALEIAADLVVVATGVRPTVKLAQETGLEIGPTGGIATDLHMCTNDPSIYAVGDCAKTRCLTGPNHCPPTFPSAPPPTSRVG